MDHKIFALRDEQKTRKKSYFEQKFTEIDRKTNENHLKLVYIIEYCKVLDKKLTQIRDKITD